MRKKPGKGRLFVCGLGINLLEDMTLRTMRTLKSCDAAYYINGDWRKILVLVKSLCPKLRYYDTADFYALDIEKRAETAGAEICAELEKGKNIAYLTYGNPMLLSDGSNLLRYCGVRGHKGAVITAPSSIDSILGLMADKNELFSQGFSVCQMSAFGERKEGPDASSACIVMCVDSATARGGFSRFCSKVEAGYPGGHRLYAVKCDDGTGKSLLFAARVKELRGLEKKIPHMTSLILPRVGAGKRRLKAAAVSGRRWQSR